MKPTKRLTNRLMSSVAVAGLFGLISGLPAQAITLKEAIAITLDSNPEIGESISNREALEFELRQGRGLYLPRVDIDATSKAQIIRNPTTRGADTEDKLFHRQEANIIVSQLLFDGWSADAEVERQASRVDAASHRVYERSEFLALAVVREYLEIALRRRVIQLTQMNVSFHNRMLGNIKEGSQQGSISVADRQQAEERLFAARARVAEAREEHNAAIIRFNRLVGKPLGNLSPAPRVAHKLPKSLAGAIGHARKHNPRIKIQQGDLDTAIALVKAAESRFFPKITLEGNARIGRDLDGVEAREREAKVGARLQWNIFAGGIDRANRQEQIRRVDEQRFKLHRIHREVEEAVRLSWDRWVQQRRRLGSLVRQSNSVNTLVGSYRDQFGVGQRSLLDLLDTQNTKFNAQVNVSIGRTAVRFAEYRILAATGNLLRTMGIKAAKGSKAYARKQAGVPQTTPSETMSRHEPKR